MIEQGVGDSKEILSQGITVDMLDRIHIISKAFVNNGSAKTIVDSDDNPLDGEISADGLLIDELTMDALQSYFWNAGVKFVGNPWTTQDQEDWLGDVSIDCKDLNNALNIGSLVLREVEGTNSFEFDGLDEAVEKFAALHRSDKKYNPDDEEQV